MDERQRVAGIQAMSRSTLLVRERLIDDVFRDAAAATVSAALFVDSFFERLRRAAENERPETFARWLAQSLEHGSPLRPPLDVATALERTLADHVSESRLGEAHACLREIQETIAQAFAAARDVRAQTLDHADAAIDALVRELDAWDTLTAHHSRAVASWCARIARALGLSDKEARHLSRCGLVHDLGKARVPAEILQAPRALDEDEWRQIRLHVLDGGDLIARNPVLEPYRDAIVSHHERLDGSGYPRGLCGAAVPFAARVVAVSDSFNAMIAHRPYRPPLAPSEALAELARYTPCHFDPDVVEALASLLGV